MSDSGYKTEAEDGEGGSGWNDQEKTFEGRRPKYTWRDPGFPQGDQHPVVNVSWNDANKFCEWRSVKSGKKVRLPREAEWEYSCRGGTTSRFYGGDHDGDLAGHANVADASLRKQYAGAAGTVPFDDGFPFTAPVGQFKPNKFGLPDMHGNVSQ